MQIANGKNGYEIPEKVGIIYSDVKREYFPTEMQFITEKGADKDARVISKYLEKLKIKPILYPGNSGLPQKLKKDKPNAVINLVDSVKGYEYLSSSIPGVLELLEIPYTGADILGMSLDTNKFVIKKLLQQNGVPVPNYQLFNSSSDFLDPTLRYPLISKLNEIHGAVEITQDAISENERHLRERIKFLIQTYKQPVLVEEFIDGREFTVSVIGNKNPKVLPIVEQQFGFLPKGMNKIASFELKWVYEDALENLSDAYDCPAKLSKSLEKRISDTSIGIFKLLDVRDCARIDYRLDKRRNLYFIEINTLPGINPDESIISYFPLAARTAGMSYGELIDGILSLACKRYNLQYAKRQSRKVVSDFN